MPAYPVPSSIMPASRVQRNTSRSFTTSSPPAPTTVDPSADSAVGMAQGARSFGSTGPSPWNVALSRVLASSSSTFSTALIVRRDAGAAAVRAKGGEACRMGLPFLSRRGRATVARCMNRPAEGWLVYLR